MAPQLQAITLDPTKCFRGILNHFSLLNKPIVSQVCSRTLKSLSHWSTVNSLWSYLLTSVEELWKNFGNTLPGIKKSALEDSAHVATPPLILRNSALAVELYHRKTLLCLGSSLKALLAQVADFGSFTFASFSSILPQWSCPKWWFAFSRKEYPADISPCVNLREPSYFSQRFLFVILLWTPPLLLMCLRIVCASSL